MHQLYPRIQYDPSALPRPRLLSPLTPYAVALLAALWLPA
jgi:hypothetical protein